LREISAELARLGKTTQSAAVLSFRRRLDVAQLTGAPADQIQSASHRA
jgi:hypothetical protein